MRFFTSDLHFDDDRLNLFGRDLAFSTKEEADNKIIENWNKTISKDDIVFVLGDVALTEKGLAKMDLCNGVKILIKGNYDEPETAKFAISDKILSKYFDKVVKEKYIKIGNTTCYLNHYPTNAKKEYFNICGHIHGTWKVQRNMLNVGTDAHHFMPVSEELVAFQINGIRKFYDQNVFAGELECNLVHKPSLKISETDVSNKPYVIVPGKEGNPELFTIFLAGPIQDAPDWQSKAIDYLNAHRGDKTFQIACPRKNYKEGEFNYDIQVNWETKHLKMASENGVVLFWLANQETFNPTRSYAQTTRYELAEWVTKKELLDATLVVGIDPGFSGERYIKMRNRHINFFDTLESTLDHALNFLE
jgi:calcineurin-like phosphoesterase family protein